MRGFAATPSGGASALFTGDEASILATLARQVAGVIDAREELSGDAVLGRLFPDAYGAGDLDAVANSAEFRRFTEDELGDEKIRNALTVAEQLDPESDSDAEDVTIELDRPGAILWLRALNDVRIALGTRLGVTDDEAVSNAIASAAFLLGVYGWLTELQYSLLDAIDGD